MRRLVLEAWRFYYKQEASKCLDTDTTEQSQMKNKSISLWPADVIIRATP